MSGEYLVRKLRAFGSLPDPSENALRAIADDRVRSVRARVDLISEGDDPKAVFLILKGWACRYKMLDDGRRQIMSIFLPGDLADLHVYILKQMDHSIAAITPLDVALIGATQLETLGDQHPRVLRALWWETLVTAAIQREWTVTIGQRDAQESLAHLCCELYLRMRIIGLVENSQCDFPLTQADMADALGLTPTHLGRCLRKLNATGFVTLHRRKLAVHNLKKLMALAAFNPDYLHHGDFD
jgi:CRP-like cAMP-binding protein